MTCVPAEVFAEYRGSRSTTSATERSGRRRRAYARTSQRRSSAWHGGSIPTDRRPSCHPPVLLQLNRQRCRRPRPSSPPRTPSPRPFLANYPSLRYLSSPFTVTLLSSSACSFSPTFYVTYVGAPNAHHYTDYYRWRARANVRYLRQLTSRTYIRARHPSHR